MINTKVALLCFVLILICSTFFANIAQQIDFEIHQTTSSKFDINSNSKKYENLSTIGESSDQLMWFIQISDLHLSIFRDPQRTTELQEFCCSTIDVIKPSVVIASGDLTDAKHWDNMGSGQYKEEWIAYADALKTCKVREKTLWLDIRGNHDNFNVPGWQSETNYFRYYSVQGYTNPRSYMQILTKGGQKFAFVALDACLEPGPRRPFNFIGMLTSDNVNEVKNLLNNAEEMKIDHTIWFGHYPTSCIISLENESPRKLIGDVKTSKVYLCGHLHQMGGLIKKMYTLQKPGFLELELGDWKDNRVIRLAAFDHSLFNFIDIRHGDWPIILVTNPKNAMYALPKREPLGQMLTSTHIRLLAFSISPIVSVEVKIDNGKWRKCSNANGPLYTSPWEPSQYQEGLHTVYASVKDEQGRNNIVEQPFSIDATKMNFGLLAKLVLMLDASVIFQCLFGTMLLISTIPLIILRYYHKKIISGNMRRPRMKNNLLYNCVRKMWVLATVDHLFYPLIVYDLYLCLGPWAVGELMEGYIGAVFAWGMLVNGVFIPGSFTYVYGFLQLFVCQFPLTLFLAHQVDKQFQHHHLQKRLNVSKISFVFGHLPFIFVISMNMLFAYFFFLAYGVVAFLLGPLRSWSVLLNAYLWYKTVSIQPKYTSEAANIWVPNNFRLRTKSTLDSNS